MKIGIGSPQPKLVVYLSNRPDLECFKSLDSYRHTEPDEVADVISKCGNHWRKIFSILAKLSFNLDHAGCGTWQQYRDAVLLTAHGNEAILFQSELADFTSVPFHLISGNAHFDSFDLKAEDFKPLYPQGKLLICEHTLRTPYFDYRQLSNALIEEIGQVIQVNYAD